MDNNEIILGYEPVVTKSFTSVVVPIEEFESDIASIVHIQAIKLNIPYSAKVTIEYIPEKRAKNITWEWWIVRRKEDG